MGDGERGPPDGAAASTGEVAGRRLAIRLDTCEAWNLRYGVRVYGARAHGRVRVEEVAFGKYQSFLITEACPPGAFAEYQAAVVLRK